MFSSTREARSAPRPQRFRPTCRSFHPLGGPRVHLFNPKSPRRSTKRRPEGVRPPDARRRVTVGDGGAVRCAVRRDPAGRQPPRHNRPRPVFRPLTATKQRAPADGPAPDHREPAGPGRRPGPWPPRVGRSRPPVRSSVSCRRRSRRHRRRTNRPRRTSRLRRSGRPSPSRPSRSRRSPTRRLRRRRTLRPRNAGDRPPPAPSPWPWTSATRRTPTAARPAALRRRPRPPLPR